MDLDNPAARSPQRNNDVDQTEEGEIPDAQVENTHNHHHEDRKIDQAYNRRHRDHRSKSPPDDRRRTHKDLRYSNRDRKRSRSPSRERGSRDKRYHSSRHVPSRDRGQDRATESKPPRTVTFDIHDDNGSDTRDRHHELPKQQKQQEEEDDEQFQKRIEAALTATTEEDEEKEIEERRRRRQEILMKHNKEKQQQAAAAAAAAAEQTASGTVAAKSSVADDSSRNDMVPSRDQEEKQALEELGTPDGGVLDIFDREQGQQTLEQDVVIPPSGIGVSLNEETQDVVIPPSGIGVSLNEETQQRMLAVVRVQKHHATGEVGLQQTNVTLIVDDHSDAAPAAPADSNSDIDDMFADTPEDQKPKTAAPGATTATAAAAAARPRGLVDSYDDAEGYYNFQIGEVIGDRFEVCSAHGRGVFSSVLRAKDLAATTLAVDAPSVPAEVAIKVIRANETMYKAGQMEKIILQKLSQADPEGKRHCIRMIGSFEYRNHLCLVFEPMDMDLRSLTKRYGRGIGLSISAVRIYAQQLLVALMHLRSCGVLHADIKPDNILVNERRTVVKICDFGSAMFSGDNEITPYLVSRFYRAPEVILGLPYDYPMDMWSIGCVIYELFTSQILFPGKTNNEMLKLFMDIKGPFPKKMLRKAEFAFKHFENDPAMSFALIEEDAVSKKPLRRLISNPTVKKDFAGLLAGQSGEKKKLSQLADLLDRMMALDPDKRISPKEALKHPFVRNA